MSDPRFPSSIDPAVLVDRRIMASAGTGKTFRLTGRFLELVLSGIDPGQILATTFTRAAAGEIRDRVFQLAAQLVLEEKARRSAVSSRRVSLSEITDVAATAALERLVEAMPNLQIRTLDSVFASLAGGLGPASGLPEEVRLVDGEEWLVLLREAIREALDAGDEEEILETLETLGRGAGRMAIVRTVENAVVDLLIRRDESTPAAWDWPMPARDVAGLEAVRASLLANREGLKPSIGKALSKVVDLIDLGCVTDGSGWLALSKNTLLTNGASSGSGTYSRTPIPEVLRPILDRLQELVEAGNLRHLARRTGCLRHLIDEIVPRLDAVKREGRVVEFDDFVRALDPQRGGVANEDLDELWFRLDTTLEHLLLDEFQDTSATQWRALRPLAAEILAGGDGERPRSFFVVGDVKQSIYGWRGGDPGILERLPEVVGPGRVDLETERLDRSWRSSPAVIDLVNRIFGGVGELAAVRDRSTAAAAHFQEIFAPHTPALDHAGEAVVEFLEAPTEEDATKDLARQAAEAAAKLVARHGLQTESGGPAVAVLVRTNKPIGPIVEALRELGIPASGRGSGSLLDAEAATLVVQAFRLAADPEDRLAAEDLARSPLGPLVGLDAPVGHGRLASEDRRRCAIALRDRFAVEGPVEVIDGWRRALASRFTAREAARWRQIVEILQPLEIDTDAPRSPRDLARLLETARVDDPGGEGVVVMSVHQSKGLEFPGVVVTEMGKPFFRQPTIAAAAPPLPAAPSERVCTWYREEGRPASSEPVHQETVDRMVLEALCTLYVAITRASHDLVIQVPRPSYTTRGELGTTSQQSWGGVVREALGRDGPEEEADDGDDATDRVLLRCTHGTRPPVKTPVIPAPTTAPEPTVPPDAESTPAWRVAAIGMRRRPIVAAPPSATSSHRREFGPGIQDALDRGTAVHACFERLEWTKDADRLSDPILREAIQRRVPGRDDAWCDEPIALFRSALEDAAIRAAIDSGAGPRAVRREYAIVDRAASRLRLGIIDRLVLELDGDPSEGATSPPSIVGAAIVDFKTDRPGDGRDADLAAFLEGHREQLEAYREAIAARYRLDPARIRVSLIRIADARVVDLPPAKAD